MVAELIEFVNFEWHSQNEVGNIRFFFRTLPGNFSNYPPTKKIFNDNQFTFYFQLRTSTNIMIFSLPKVVNMDQPPNSFCSQLVRRLNCKLLLEQNLPEFRITVKEF